MKSTRQWILFSLLRVGVFALAMVVLVVLGAPPWLAAIIAAVIGLCVSYLFLSRQRAAVAASIEDFRRSKHVDLDAEAENDAIDRELLDHAPDALDDELADSRDDLPPAGARPAAVTFSRSTSEREGGAEAETEEQRRETGQL